jgi:ABC-type nitrate/sulfonate/bicarbonate transport system substrate-binding protein
MRSRITEDSTGYWVADFVTDVRNGLNGGIWITGRDWASHNRATVEAFNAAVSEALAFIKAHPDQTRTIELKYLKIASPTRPYLSMDLTAEDLKFFQDLMLEMGALPQPVDVSKLIFH